MPLAPRQEALRDADMALLHMQMQRRMENQRHMAMRQWALAVEPAAELAAGPPAEASPRDPREQREPRKPRLAERQSRESAAGWGWAGTRLVAGLGPGLASRDTGV